MDKKYLIPSGFKVISGGQTGADRAGLDWAMSHQIPHGGWCPKGLCGAARGTPEVSSRATLCESPDQIPRGNILVAVSQMKK